MTPTPEQLRATAESYIAALNAGDVDGLTGIYAMNATVEDPVGGGTVHEGTEAIRGFYTPVAALDCEAELLETRACGKELLVHFVLTTHVDENTALTIDVWDLMVFDEAGEVRSMKAYWGPENMR